MFQDLRYALRSFARSPGLVTAAVVCLALGIGANATIFGVVDTLLFRAPPHVQDPARVTRLYFRRNLPPFGTATSSITGYPLYTSIRDAAHAFNRLAAFTYAQRASLGRGAEARRVDLVLASASFFPLLGVRPTLGRFFTADEDRPGGPAIVVLSFAFWRSAFGGDSAVIGRQLALGRGSYTVIGVAPDRFTGVNLENVDVWAPIAAATPELLGPGSMNRGSYFLQIIGRVSSGGAATAVRQATLVFRRDDVYSGHDSSAVVVLGPIQYARGPEMSQNAKVSIWLAAVAVIVLLVACANVANLLLARSLQRQREVAIRVALGAGWWRLTRQVLIESLVLASAGGIAALFVTLWAGPLIRAFLLPDTPAFTEPLDARVITFTSAVALLTGIVVGAVPAWQLARRDLTPALKAGAGEGRYQRSRLRSALLVAQVALTVVLIIGAGLFTRSLRNVEGQNFGFDPEHTLLETIDLRATGYSPAQINAFYLQILARLEALPGVEAAAATVAHPLGWVTGCWVSVPGRDSIPRLSTGGPYCQQVTPGYFAAIGTPVRGRAFTSGDRAGSVAIVNETMARVLWPGENAIGKCFVPGDAKFCTEVIGVVADARRFNAVEEPSMMFYVPFSGNSDQYITALVVRTRGEPEEWIGQLRAAILETAPNLPFVQITPLADLLAPSIRPWRLGSTMFAGFALLALVLSAVGLYGVLAYIVTQRTHEMGVRVAMGAQRWDVQGLMVSHGVRVTVVGAALGALGGLVAGRVLSSLLYGVSPRDPLVLFAAVVVPVVVAAVASYLPARRASRVDPVVALRAE
jgi:putative ABC transport system permease protein